jgi:alcohol dehydrogenase class IV
MPPEVTASTGLDTITQLLEAYTCNRTNPITDALALSGLSRALNALPIAFREGTPEVREAMAYSSLCSGLALANAGLGAVHGFASVLGGRYPVPHGVCCAALLPHVVRGNIAALSAREPQNPALARYGTVLARITGGLEIGQVVLDKLVDEIRELVHTMHIPPLSTYGVTIDAVPDLVTQSQQASSMKANPIKLTTEELTQILMAAL